MLGCAGYKSVKLFFISSLCEPEEFTLWTPTVDTLQPYGRAEFGNVSLEFR